MTLRAKVVHNVESSAKTAVTVTGHTAVSAAGTSLIWPYVGSIFDLVW